MIERGGGSGAGAFYDLSIDSTAAEAEPQVPGSFATLLNYPTTTAFFSS